MSVTADDLAAALDDVPAQARRIAERREEIERQHATVDVLRAKALRVSVSGRCFDMGGGNFFRLESSGPAPTPRDSDILFLMYVLPCSQWDVDDFHGGWSA